MSHKDAGIGEKSWKKSEAKVQISNNKELRPFRGNISPWKVQDHIALYEHENKILAVVGDDIGSQIRDHIFLMRYGEQIGVVDHGKFVVSHRAWKYLDIGTTPIYILPDEASLDRYLRGEPIVSVG
jgi:hypothetical protein